MKGNLVTLLVVMLSLPGLAAEERKMHAENQQSNPDVCKIRSVSIGC